MRNCRKRAFSGLRNCQRNGILAPLNGEKRCSKEKYGENWRSFTKSPLKLSEKRNLFKLFANDVGLLAAMYANGIQLRILADENGLNIGAVYENVVAQELLAKGLAPYYYHSKKKGELDFVVERGDGVTPIEVKSGKDYKRHNALSNVLADVN